MITKENPVADIIKDNSEQAKKFGLVEEDGKYPDILAPKNLPEGLHKLEPNKNFKRKAPKIKWGDKHKKLPVHARMKAAEDLACAMNHAADVLQQDNRRLNQIAKSQFDQLVDLKKKIRKQNEMMTMEIGNSNREKQELNNRIVELNNAKNKLAQENRELRKRLESK